MEGNGSLTEFLDHPFVFLTREGATPRLWAGHLSVALMTPHRPPLSTAGTVGGHSQIETCTTSSCFLSSTLKEAEEREICVSHSRREQQLAQGRAARHPRPFTRFPPTSLPECNLLISGCL